MQAFVVYESMYGNPATNAEAIGRGLTAAGRTGGGAPLGPNPPEQVHAGPSCRPGGARPDVSPLWGVDTTGKPLAAPWSALSAPGPLLLRATAPSPGASIRLSPSPARPTRVSRTGPGTRTRGWGRAPHPGFVRRNYWGEPGVGRGG